MATKTWADTKMEELEQKNKLDWTADDWDSYCYIMNFSAETDGYEREYDEPDTHESGLGGLGATPSVEELNDEAEAWAERELRRMRLESENVPDYSNRGPYGYEPKE